TGVQRLPGARALRDRARAAGAGHGWAHPPADRRPRPPPQLASAGTGRQCRALVGGSRERHLGCGRGCAGRCVPVYDGRHSGGRLGTARAPDVRQPVERHRHVVLRSRDGPARTVHPPHIPALHRRGSGGRRDCGAVEAARPLALGHGAARDDWGHDPLLVGGAARCADERDRSVLAGAPYIQRLHGEPGGRSGHVLGVDAAEEQIWKRGSI
ncbi:MAG: hypothetical protein AVDCRST_MAG89-2477, partial [uncultured Gemmatimonadetes bacterium]